MIRGTLIFKGRWSTPFSQSPPPEKASLNMSDSWSKLLFYQSVQVKHHGVNIKLIMDPEMDPEGSHNQSIFSTTDLRTLVNLLVR